MTAQPIALPHPLTTGVATVAAALDRMSIEGWDALDETEVKRLATELMRIESRVKAHQAVAMRVLDESGLAKRSGATSTGSMVASEFGGDRRSGDAMVRTGKLLGRSGKVQDALAAGKVTERQAKVIAGKTDALDTCDENKQRCQQRLIVDAKRMTLKDLERRADRITDLFKPEPEVDADENETLERREARAWGKAEFRLWDNHDGTQSGKFTIPEAQADKLKAALDHLAAPRRDHLHERNVPDGTATPNKLGRAFAELCDRLTGENLMGSDTVAVVNIDDDTLQDAVKAATLSSGTRISASEARLTACKSKIFPAVLGGRSQVLDLGRAQRLFSKAQKIAMRVRDKGCVFPGCDRPPEWCEAHHLRPWNSGGRTDLDDGVLLCAHHHRTVHLQRWTLRRADDGTVEFRPPGTAHWQRHVRFRT